MKCNKRGEGRRLEWRRLESIFLDVNVSNYFSANKAVIYGKWKSAEPIGKQIFQVEKYDLIN